MAAQHLDRLTRYIDSFAAFTPRRTLLHGASALAAALGAAALSPGEVEARIRCRKSGSRCKKKSKRCRARNCLKTPFTIEARWTNPETDHDTYLFVPNDVGAHEPSPYIEFRCSSEDTNGGALYPFAFVSGDAQGPGDEITTVAQLLAGTYEYWILLYPQSPDGDLTIDLRNATGRIMRSWISPPNLSLDTIGWHIFDIDGSTRDITSIDALIDDTLPNGAHDPNRDACPD
ncbi:MAG: hypothetical protein ACRDJC_16000 [Thermomicrobiales bacterium]